MTSATAAAPVAFTGTFDQVQEYFHQRQWTDGLPIVPPTRAAVEQFLERTSRDPGEVLGVLGPQYHEATVLSVAVNGVMAGCRPEYMPILVAIVEAIASREFRIEDGGSTPGWEPLVILSGEIVSRLDFNVGAGVMRIGRRANSTIGRFVKLYTRNVAGLRIPPGDSDRATIGMNFNVVLPENEAVVQEIGWPTFGQDRGFRPGEDVVTVQSVVGASMPLYSAGATALDHATMIADVIGSMWAYWSFTGMHYGKYYPLLLLSPSIARAIASDGWSKDDLRTFLGEQIQRPASLLERYAFAAGLTDFNIRDLVDAGRLPDSYAASSDPDRLVRCIPDPSMIGIIVSGDAHRNQSKGYVQNQEQGVPSSRWIGQ